MEVKMKFGLGINIEDWPFLVPKWIKPKAFIGVTQFLTEGQQLVTSAFLSRPVTRITVDWIHVDLTSKMQSNI